MADALRVVNPGRIELARLVAAAAGHDREEVPPA